MLENPRAKPGSYRKCSGGARVVYPWKCSGEAQVVYPWKCSGEAWVVYHLISPPLCLEIEAELIWFVCMLFVCFVFLLYCFVLFVFCTSKKVRLTFSYVFLRFSKVRITKCSQRSGSRSFLPRRDQQSCTRHRECLVGLWSFEYPGGGKLPPRPASGVHSSREQKIENKKISIEAKKSKQL